MKFPCGNEWPTPFIQIYVMDFNSLWGYGESTWGTKTTIANLGFHHNRCQAPFIGCLAPVVDSVIA